MKRKTLKIIVVLAILLVTALVTAQLFWLSAAYRLQEKQFSHDVSEALATVTKQILRHNNDSSSFYDPVKQINTNLYIVSINDTLHPYYLESLLKTEFSKNQIDIDFEYSIYDCFTDSVVYTDKATTLEELGSSEALGQPEINWENDGHYFGVYFPNMQSHLLKKMGFWFVSSVLFLLVLIFFGYTISIILKQKRLSEIKTDFINNMTHELKTPISTISLSSEALMNDKILEQPDRLKNYANIIYSENERLKNQVDRVLQVASIEKESISLQLNRIDIHLLITAIVNNLKLNLDKVNAIIELRLNSTISEINADEVHISNILKNLIDNAIKYSKKDPKIIISTVLKGNDMHITINDNGMGISKAHLPYIFEKFFRVPTGNLHNVKGFGLGLYYVKTMIDAQGGRVLVKSILDEGTTFTLIIPTC